MIKDISKIKKFEKFKNISDKELWEIFKKTNNEEIREFFVVKYMPLVKRIAKNVLKKQNENIHLQDLISWGIFGLLDAIEKYIPSKDKKFETYASIRIRGAIIDEIRKSDILPRYFKDRLKEIIDVVEEIKNEKNEKINISHIYKELSKRTGIKEKKIKLILLKSNEFLSNKKIDFIYRKTNDDQTTLSFLNLVESKNTNPVYLLEKQEEKDILKKAINELPEREQKIIILRYYYDFNFTEISKMLNLSSVRISQLHSKALSLLKEKLKSI
jgi:RNA polymerase sigma factor for flagellar operon FliA